MMKRALVIASLVGPILLLVGLRLFPELDFSIHQPLFHFYIVTFFTSAAAIVSLFIAYALQQAGLSRYQLLPTAFATMGSIFLVHGLFTPEAIFFANNPGVRWAAWLTLFMGGLVFLVATFNPTPPQIRRINLILFLSVVGFALIVAFTPQWLTYIDENVAPFHRWLAFTSTILAWLFVMIRLGWRWRQTGETIEGVMTLIAAWQVIGAISMHQFPTWHISWWLYHIELLMGVLLASVVLVQQYERLRQFRLTSYFALTSLIVTVASALLASHLFSLFVERELVRALQAQAQQSGMNVAMAVVHDLPEPVTTETLNAAAADSLDLDYILWQQLIGLSVEYVNIYDTDGNPLLPDPYAHTSLNQTDVASVSNALTGTATTELLPALPEDEHLLAEHTITEGPRLRTYVPLPGADPTQPVGVLLLQQPVPELNPTVTRARLQGLLIGGVSMGLLFLALLGIVRRADQVITNRTNDLAQANAHLRAAEAARDELTNMIVHDLRTPLTTVIMGLEWLQKLGDDPERQANRNRFLSNARSSADRLIDMINDLLDVNRLEAGRLQPHLTPTNINELLDRRAAAYSPLVESDEKQIAVQSTPSLPLIPTDVTLMERVLDNLIGNALKYTQPGGHITLCAQRQDGHITVSVTDDGEGVPLAYQARIFDKFVQVTNDEGQPIRKGTGLGLTFCRLVVEAHGGNIWVESQPEQGSRFFFTLPIRGSLPG